MSKTTKLNIMTPMYNFITGKPYLNLSASLKQELGIKTEDDIEKFADQIPKVTFDEILNGCFDLIPLASKSEYATYNNILIDIRTARRQNETTITVDKEELEKLKTIFEKGVINKPELNRKIGFILEVLEQSLSDIVVNNNIDIDTTQQIEDTLKQN